MSPSFSLEMSRFINAWFESKANSGEHRLHFMQYTGLKSKSGVDIYEGDVVQTKEGYEGYVEWIPERCGYGVLQTMKGYEVPQYKCELSPFREPEIIGNIYENPNLLNDDAKR